MIQLDDRYYVKYQDPGNFTLMYEKRPEDLTEDGLKRLKRLNRTPATEVTYIPQAYCSNMSQAIQAYFNRRIGEYLGGDELVSMNEFLSKSKELMIQIEKRWVELENEGLI